MSFKLSNKSLNKLTNVHPDLVRVVKKAIEISTTDFSVTEGERSLAQQQANVKKGVSQTLKSKHLKQDDGYVHAVDLVPYPVNWDLNAFYPIANAMQQAAEALNIKVRWGGCWALLNGDKRSPMRMVKEYSDVRRQVGNKVFIDAPHFEIVE